MFLTVGKKVKTGLFCTALLCALPLMAASRSKAPEKKATGKLNAPAHSTAIAHKSHATASHSSHAKAQNSAASVKVASARGGAGRHGKGKLAKVAGKPRARGQQSIDNLRALEIQQALVREHYLESEPSGEWDQATREALTRFQGDNHWQTKVLPDSRALIKLGLGPSHQNLLNPESAAIAQPRQLADRPASAAAN